MTDKPLGRDRLGRLIYKGDCVWPSYMQGLNWFSDRQEPDGRVVFVDWFNFQKRKEWPESVTVGLSASPKRSFYERYFADLGTLAEVAWIALSLIQRNDPVFVDLIEAIGTLDFGGWLQQEATV